jgi:hypothetical protein
MLKEADAHGLKLARAWVDDNSFEG